MDTKKVKREECLYQSCYCEENVYKLCEQMMSDGWKKGEVFAIVVSNPNKTVPLWKQRSGEVVVWDYHVFVIAVPSTPHNGGEEERHGERDEESEKEKRGEKAAFVYDLDTTLPFPCPFSMYFESGIRHNATLRPHYWRYFRVVEATEYLRTFSSTREHMLDEHGDYLQPPPPWGCIRGEDASTPHQLKAYLDFSQSNGKEGAGTVVDDVGLIELFLS
mmetsp:Transcript_23693/g.59713  ORF Transcript_23693/g.59713 Transcript_23693/m.59713 type:complete len:218 (-) Transcript_23693:1662-2315(-)